MAPDPPVLGLTEVAKMLGVSTPRVAQLARAYPDFPEPIAVLSVGRIWAAKDVRRWMKAHPERRPGRPRKETS